MKTLFIGNSHTYFNDMPHLFQEICEQNGYHMDVTMLTKGGMGLDYHVENEQTRFNILYGRYDFIILQHVAHPMGEYEVMEKAADKLMEWIRKTNATPCYYMTWTKKDDEQGQEEMSARYRRLGAKHNCIVAPVGEVWWKTYHAHPETELYFEDGRHASYEGSMLAARTIYDALSESFVRE